MKYLPLDCLAPGKRERYITLIDQGKYHEPIVAIWRTSKNPELRAQFFALVADKYAPPIMFEEAIAQFTANPTAGTLRKARRIFESALLRMKQDLMCTKTPLLYHDYLLIKRMHTLYYDCLKKKAEKILPHAEGCFLTIMSEPGISEEKNEVEFLTSWLIKKAKLPPPDWMNDERDVPPFKTLPSGPSQMRLFENGAQFILLRSAYDRLRNAFARDIEARTWAAIVRSLGLRALGSP